MIKLNSILAYSLSALSLIIVACNTPTRKMVEPVPVPKVLQEDKDELMDEMLTSDNEELAATAYFKNIIASKELLKGGLWTKDSIVLALSDSLVNMVEHGRFYGLDPKRYNPELLIQKKAILKDSVGKLDLSNWILFETISTSTFLSICNDVHFGRLKEDSIDQRSLRSMNDSMAIALIKRLHSGEQISTIINSLEPKHLGYHLLKGKLNEFVPKMRMNKFTFVSYPWKDSILFIDQLSARLTEGGYMEKGVEHDSVYLSNIIRKAQVHLGLKVDGKAGQQLSEALNKWDYVDFARMAVNMDRYRMLPDSMPSAYAFVNIPSFSLRVKYNDTIAVKSKVIVGKVKTPSPVLNSKFANLVLFPQWTVPYSIVFKEIAPKMAKDLTYLKAENMFIVDRKDSIVDPAKIKWSKINASNFHYQIRQGEGIDNSLGILKFNFANKYAVYLHDTNARSLFSLDKRMLSHGCIRVEKWKDLASFLLEPSTSPKPSEQLTQYLEEEKKRGVPLKTRIPLFIRYFTWFELDGELRQFQDGYGVDNDLIYSYLRD